MIDVIQNEGDPATVNWRTNRLGVWAKIIAQRDADYAAAAKHTNADAAAKYANDRIRATVRAFMAEILKRSSQVGAADFISNAPPGWIARTERLLSTGELVPRLIRRSYPFATWAKQISDLQQARAAIDSDWEAWANHFLDTLGTEVGIGFDAVGTAAGEAAGAVGGFLKGVGTLVQYAPYIAAGGAVLVIVVALRR